MIKCERETKRDSSKFTTKSFAFNNILKSAQVVISKFFKTPPFFGRKAPIKVKVKQEVPFEIFLELEIT